MEGYGDGIFQRGDGEERESNEMLLHCFMLPDSFFVVWCVELSYVELRTEKKEREGRRLVPRVHFLPFPFRRAPGEREERIGDEGMLAGWLAGLGWSDRWVDVR